MIEFILDQKRDKYASSPHQKCTLIANYVYIGPPINK